MAQIPVNEPETFAFNPGSGVAHLWACRLGPARSGGKHRSGYVAVPDVVLPWLPWRNVCTKCLPDLAAMMHDQQEGISA